MNTTKDERELLSVPGDTILETIEFMRMSQAELALRLGKTPAKINDLISGKAPITVNTALQLEKVLGIDMQFWLNREMRYREKLARIEQEEFFELCLDWLKQQPVKELKNLGYLKADKIGIEMVDECLKFYGVASPDQWESLYINEYASTEFRKSVAHSTALSSMAAWLRVGEIKALQANLVDYSKEKFKEVLQEIKLLVADHPENFAKQLKGLSALAGVVVLYSKNMPKAPISGAARWIGGRPVIQITDRYKTNDQFWFTFFHEAAHILLHGKRDIFIEEFDGFENDETKENEANDFAQKLLLSDDFLKEIGRPITERAVRAVARAYNTHSGIVVGRLQRLNIVPYSFGEKLKMKVDLQNYTEL